MSHLSDEVELVVSKLAPSALVHAQTAFKVTLDGFEHTLLLEVEDGSGTGPFRVVPQLLDTGSRGIANVDRFSRDWGVASRVGGGKAVWAECDVPAHSPARGPW